VIAKSAKIAFSRRVYEFALVERHEVEMLDPFFVILSHSAMKAGFCNDFANILEDEIIWPQIRVST
jgi:hypothetical protein